MKRSSFTAITLAMLFQVGMGLRMGWKAEGVDANAPGKKTISMATVYHPESDIKLVPAGLFDGQLFTPRKSQRLAALPGREAERVSGKFDDNQVLHSFKSGEQLCKRDAEFSFEKSPMPREKHVALLLVGEAFRSRLTKCTQEQWNEKVGKGELNEIRPTSSCTNGTYAVQNKLVEWNLKNLIIPLEQEGHTVDIYLTFYEQPECARLYFTNYQEWFGKSKDGADRVKAVRHSADDNQWRNRLNSLEWLFGATKMYGGYEQVIIGRHDYAFGNGPRPVTAYSYNDDQRIEIPFGFLNCFVSALEDCELGGPATQEKRNCGAGPITFGYSSLQPGNLFQTEMDLADALPKEIGGTPIVHHTCPGGGNELGVCEDHSDCASTLPDCRFRPTFFYDCPYGPAINPVTGKAPGTAVMGLR